MSDKAGTGQSGGVSISGQVGNVGGSIVGGDQITGAIPDSVLEAAMRPISDAIAASASTQRAAADASLAALKQEVAKGKDAKDDVVAKLVDGLVALVPSAATAVVSAFGTPILGALVGPVTSYVLGKLRGG